MRRLGICPRLSSPRREDRALDPSSAVRAGPIRMTPPTLLFDVVGTLVELRNPVGQVYAEAARPHGVELPDWRLGDAFQRVLERADPLDYSTFALEDARAQEIEWWRQRVRSTFRAADSTVVFDNFERFFDELFAIYASARGWRLRPSALETLRELAARGHRLGVVSNFDHRLPDLLEELGITSFFECVVIPSSCGSSKPDTAIFTAALEQLGVSPQTTLYVGDDPEKDIAAAESLGLATVDVSELASLTALPDRVAALA